MRRDLERLKVASCRSQVPFFCRRSLPTASEFGSQTPLTATRPTRTLDFWKRKGSRLNGPATCEERRSCDLRIPATCDLRPATCDLRPATCDLRPATPSQGFSTCLPHLSLGNDDLDPTVLFSAIRRRIVGNRTLHAIAHRRYPHARNTLGYKKIEDRVGPLFGQRQVRGCGTRGVGVTFDPQIQVGHDQENTGQLGDDQFRLGLQSGLPTSKRISGRFTMNPRADSRVSAT